MSQEVVSGISSCFQLLFQSQGQVAHVLLTRSPLVYPRRGLTVRLACVKHAASVRPEPGSNSPLKSIGCDPRRAVFRSQLVRSLTSDPLLDLAVNQSKEPNSSTGEPGPEYGVFCAYLALTFSTLLSSQASGAHRVGASTPAWGNLTNFMRYTRPSQTRLHVPLPMASPASGPDSHSWSATPPGDLVSR